MNTLNDWSVITLEDWALIRRLAAEGMPKAKIAKRLGISRTTVINAVTSDSPPRYERTAGPTSFTPFEGFSWTPERLLDGLADTFWKSEPPDHVQEWREHDAGSLPLPDESPEFHFVHKGNLRAILGERRAPGPREDLEVSNFQAHRYHRHIREHQGFWRDRHRTLATTDDLIDYLVWSLKEFADAHPYRDLPVYDVDAEILNRRALGSGLLQWNTLELEGSLDFTQAQLRFFGEGRSFPMRDADAYADALLAWLGYWGARHRGASLLTESQILFLARPRRNTTDPTVAEALAISPFASARWRECRRRPKSRPMWRSRVRPRSCRVSSLPGLVF